MGSSGDNSVISVSILFTAQIGMGFLELIFSEMVRQTSLREASTMALFICTTSQSLSEIPSSKFRAFIPMKQISALNSLIFAIASEPIVIFDAFEHLIPNGKLHLSRVIAVFHQSRKGCRYERSHSDPQVTSLANSIIVVPPPVRINIHP